MVTRVVVTTVNQNMIYFISFCNATENSQWLLLCGEIPGDVVIKVLDDYHVTIIWRLHCTVAVIVVLWQVTKWHSKLKLSCEKCSWWLYSSRFFKCQSPKSHRVTSLWYYLMTRHNATHMMTSHWNCQMTVTLRITRSLHCNITWRLATTQQSLWLRNEVTCW